MSHLVLRCLHRYRIRSTRSHLDVDCLHKYLIWSALVSYGATLFARVSD